MEFQGRGDEIDLAGHHLTRSDTIRRSLRSIWINSGPSGIFPSSLGKNQHARTVAANMGCAPSAWREAPLINVERCNNFLVWYSVLTQLPLLESVDYTYLMFSFQTTCMFVL